MKNFIVFVLLIGLIRCGNASPATEKTDDKVTFKTIQYFPMNVSHSYKYSGYFDNSLTKTIISDTNTFVLKEYKNKNLTCYYYWEDSPPVYSVGYNVFFWGAFLYKDSSLFIHQIDGEAEIPSLSPNNFQLLFPKTISPGYSIMLNYEHNRKIKYIVVGLETISSNNKTYTNCLKVQIEDSWDEKEPSIGYVWLKENIGVIKWQRPTGRVENLIGFVKGNISNTNQEPEYLFLNSKGDKKLTSELLDGQKFNSEYSRAIYNDSGFLIQEIYFGSTGEMEITEIEYVYDTKNRLTKEIYHYSKNDLWVSEFIYDSSDRLIEYRSKMSQRDKEYYIRHFYKYDDKKNTYGLGKNPNEIICDRPTKSTQEIVSKLLYSHIHPLRK